MTDGASLKSRIRNYLTMTLWERAPEEFRGLQRFRLLSLQFIVLLLRNSWRNQCLLRAAALAFTTLLSLVPFLAILFALLKEFGVQNQVEPFLLEQLSAGSQDVASRIIRYIDNTNMTSLGGFGLAGLLVTVIMLLDSIEDAFNEIWLVRETRTLRRKLGGYIALIVSTPALIFIALSVTTFLESRAVVHWLITASHLGHILPFILQLIPYLAICTALTFLYLLVPNTTVNPGSALRGAFFAGTLWQLAQGGYIHFQIGVAKNNAIYGTMAALPTFMVWVYVSWLILLFGVEVVHAHQNIISLRREIRAGTISYQVRELLCLTILQDMAVAADRGQQGWTATHLREELDLPERTLKELLSSLGEAGYVVASAAAPTVYALTAEPADIMVNDVLSGLRTAAGSWQPLSLTESESGLAEILEKVDESRAAALAGISLLQIAQQATPAKARSAH